MTKQLLAVLWLSFAINALADFNIGGIKVKVGPKVQQQTSTQSAPNPTKPSQVCDGSARMRLCYVFTGAENNEAKTKKGNEFACKLMRSQLVASGVCPTIGALGKCDVLSGQPKAYTLFYYSGGRLSKPAAERDCANAKSSIHIQGPGVWSAF